jgi:hypothetical protein
MTKKETEKTDTTNTTDRMSIWDRLAKIDVSDHVEEKGGFTYLSWAWAWMVVKQNYPDASFVKHVNPETGLPLFSHPSVVGGFVKVTVTVEDVSTTETYPVLDYNNRPVKDPNSFDINTALQRCMTKVLAYMGLGIYIFAGEDLPPNIEKKAEISFGDTDGPEPVPESRAVKGVEMIVSVFNEFLPLHDNVKSLESFWLKNKAALDILKSSAPDEHAALVANFKKQKNKVLLEGAVADEVEGQDTGPSSDNAGDAK